MLLLDVDRTLLPGKDVVLSPAMRRWLVGASRQLHLHLVSNNPSRQRIKAVADQIGVDFTCGASKPRRRAISRIIEKLPIPSTQIAMVGDRFFTDVLAGNRLGLFTVLVRPPNAEGFPCQNDRVQRLERRLALLLGSPCR